MLLQLLLPPLHCVVLLPPLHCGMLLPPKFPLLPPLQCVMLLPPLHCGKMFCDHINRHGWSMTHPYLYLIILQLTANWLNEAATFRSPELKVAIEKCCTPTMTSWQCYQWEKPLLIHICTCVTDSSCGSPHRFIG